MGGPTAPLPMDGGGGDLDRKLVLKLLLGAHALFTGCFFICACVAAKTANMGFNVVFTSFCFGFHVAVGILVIHRSLHTQLWVGFLLGLSGATAWLSLQTAIFWGQLADCDRHAHHLSQYSCSNVSAYKAVCAFAALLFILQGGLFAVLAVWKDDFSPSPAEHRYSDLMRGSMDTDGLFIGAKSEAHMHIHDAGLDSQQVAPGGQSTDL
uniref:MARVEL domain-containing protein n=1 Tax=Rhizochromulina marina TaxID=1034831 RepID=A0A7S2S6Q8_9STRA